MGHHYTRHPANVDERDKGGIQMRSLHIQLPGIALVAALGVSLLTGCSAASSAEDFDSSKISCSDVVEQLKDAKADLKDAKATLADAKDTPDEVIASDDVTTAEAKVTALKERSKECADEAETAVNNDEPKIELSDELKALLDASRAPSDRCLAVVKEHLGDDAVVNGTYTLRVEPAMGTTVKEGDPAALQWSDALDLILQGSTPEEMKGNLELAICTRPLIGVSLAHLFAHTEVLDLQKTDWLDFANVDDSKISGIVDGFVPLLYAGETITDKEYEESATAARDYEDMSSKLLFLLNRYELGQVMPINSTHHYHLVSGGRTADGTPEVEVSTELDSRPALVFFLTEKTECKPISVLAFNIGDKRPELADIPDDCTPLLPPQCTTDCGETDCVTDCTDDSKTRDTRYWYAPGEGDERDAGEGEKPPVVATPTAEPTPPPVVVTPKPSPTPTLPPVVSGGDGPVTD